MMRAMKGTRATGVVLRIRPYMQGKPLLRRLRRDAWAATEWYVEPARTFETSEDPAEGWLDYRPRREAAANLRK